MIKMTWTSSEMIEVFSTSFFSEVHPVMCQVDEQCQAPVLVSQVQIKGYLISTVLKERRESRWSKASRPHALQANPLDRLAEGVVGRFSKSIYRMAKE
jgi:hypothetical protein